MFLTWWRSLAKQISARVEGSRRSQRRRAPSRSRRCVLWAEPLEDRVLLTTPTSVFFSMPTNLSPNQGTVVSVPVSINHLFDADGNSGLSATDLVLTYDSTEFTVSDSDISQGVLLTSSPASGTWTFTTNTTTPGEIDISASSGGALNDITNTAGGVLANINFHVKNNAPFGSPTAIHIVVPSEISPNGQTSDAFDHLNVAGYTLNPGDQVNGGITIQNFQPVSSISIPKSQQGTAGNTLQVPINVANPNPNGSAGLVSADAVILFDPTLLSVAATGAVSAGTVVPVTGWMVSYTVDTSGNNGIDSSMYALDLNLVNTNSTPLMTTSAGSLWQVTFGLNSTQTGTTALNLVPSAQVNGSTATTDLVGANKTYLLNPAPTDSPTDQVDGSIQVNPGPATHFTVSAPSQATAGIAFMFTVTAQDQFGNTTPNYAGTVHFTSSDGAASLPGNATLTNGMGTFSATLRTGTGTMGPGATITATDVVTHSITGSTGPIVVAAPTTLAVSAPSPVNAGSAFNFTVTALDQFGQTASGYTGTVHFTTSAASAVLPGNMTLTNGVGTFSATLKSAGSQTITATDTVTNSIHGTSSTITVNPLGANTFLVSAPGSATAGTAFNFTVTAQDQYGNTATGYGGNVHFTSTDGAALLPLNSPLTSGVGTFSATLKTAGSRTITATDTTTNSITGTSSAITVNALAASHLVVSTPSNASAGTAFNFTVTAQDQYNNTVGGYTGTIHFTSTDGSASLPVNSTLSNGVGTFSATLKTAGSRTITATDTQSGSITGTSNAISVSAGAATHFLFTVPPSTSAGTQISFTVTAVDQFNNTAAGYTGTVHFTSNDPQATAGAGLPLNSTLTNGMGSFSATFKTAGGRTLTATDTTTASITGTSSAVTVTPLAATKLVVSAPSSVTRTIAFNFTVTAQDQFGNTAPTYAGTVHLTSSDGQAVLPANATLVNGVRTFSATLKTTGNQTLTATDTVSAAIKGTSSAINVFIPPAPPATMAGTGVISASVAFDSNGVQYEAIVFVSTQLWIYSAVYPGGSSFIGSHVINASIAFNPSGTEVLDVVFDSLQLYSYVGTNPGQQIGSPGAGGVSVAFDKNGGQWTAAIFSGVRYLFSPTNTIVSTVSNVQATGIGFDINNNLVEELVDTSGVWTETTTAGTQVKASGMHAVAVAYNPIGQQILEQVFASSDWWHN